MNLQKDGFIGVQSKLKIARIITYTYGHAKKYFLYFNEELLQNPAL